MPEMAFEPDINGVCKEEGTFAINSKPSALARRKMKRSVAVSIHE
jgi:hypothetical protein